MFGLGTLSRSHRLVLGLFILLLVDVIWVTSTKVTEHVFEQAPFNKPFFETYLKNSLLLIYFAGFLFKRSWWAQCGKNVSVKDETEEDIKIETGSLLSEPIFVPLKTDDKLQRGTGSLSGSDSEESSLSQTRSVRFSNLSEVRQLSEAHAEEAVMSRLSYSAYVRAEEARVRLASKLTVKHIAKLAFVMCTVFFCANLAYQEAMQDTQVGVVHMLSSTSALFTLVLAAMFPAGTHDRFTLSKFVAVLLSIGGIVMVSLSGRRLDAEIPIGALWALCGALLYAIYLVMIRRRCDSEDKLNIPMFLGFLGLFASLLLWPCFFVLHLTRAEPFIWPGKVQCTFLIVHGVVGTVISELLWLWGCFLTSSLVATLSLSLTIPMAMIADVIIKDVSYNWMFFVGMGPVFVSFFAVAFLTNWMCFADLTVSYNWMFFVGMGPVFVSFFAVAFLTYYETWDPVLLAVKKLLQCFCRRRLIPGSRMRDLDREQTESLIGIAGDGLGRVDT